MPAGDLLPTSGEHFALELRGFLAAEGETWQFRDIAGLGDAVVRSQDTALALADGVVAATDTLDAVALVFTLVCNTGLASTAEVAYLDVAGAFTAGGEEELHLYVPGIGHVYFVGRARGSVARRVSVPSGVMLAQCTFLATSPTMVEVPPPEEP